MFESASWFVHEVNLQFSPAGLEMLRADNTDVLFVGLHFPVERILETGGIYDYDTDQPRVNVGVNLKMISAMLKRTSVDDTIGFVVDADEPGFIKIIEANTRTTKYSLNKLRTIHISDTDQYNDLNNVKYTSSIVMESTMFADIIKKLDIVDSDSIRVWCDGKRLVFSSRSSFVESTLQVELSEDSSMPVTSKAPDGVLVAAVKSVEPGINPAEHSTVIPQCPPGDKITPAGIITNGAAAEDGQTVRWPLDEEYPKDFLVRIAKAKNASRKITMHLSKFFSALTMSYDTYIGSLRFILAPKKKKMVTPLDKSTADGMPVGLDLPPPHAHALFCLPGSKGVNVRDEECKKTECEPRKERRRRKRARIEKDKPSVTLIEQNSVRIEQEPGQEIKQGKTAEPGDQRTKPQACTPDISRQNKIRRTESGENAEIEHVTTKLTEFIHGSVVPGNTRGTSLIPSPNQTKVMIPDCFDASKVKPEFIDDDAHLSTAMHPEPTEPKSDESVNLEGKRKKRRYKRLKNPDWFDSNKMLACLTELRYQTSKDTLSSDASESRVPVDLKIPRYIDAGTVQSDYDHTGMPLQLVDAFSSPAHRDKV
jgi:hypothetical protein